MTGQPSPEEFSANMADKEKEATLLLFKLMEKGQIDLSQPQARGRTDGISADEQGKKTRQQMKDADAPDAPDRPDEPIFRNLTNLGEAVDHEDE